MWIVCWKRILSIENHALKIAEKLKFQLQAKVYLYWTTIDPVIDEKENEVASRLTNEELATLLDNYKKLFVTL
ncbi:MAG: hypothetical protein CM15mP83_6650 [Flavobacteriaceae bacterium]|nr:MAG: hypothetical protein CM15mP83_6650 [Flavobacteriaceae bacterium]